MTLKRSILSFKHLNGFLMAVQLWGYKPEHPSEREALSFLYKRLKPLDEPYWLLTNFEIPPQVDLLVIKRDGLFLSELKHCEGGRVVGSLNGDWKVLDEKGRVLDILNRGMAENPYQQLIHQYCKLRDLLSQSRHKFLTESSRDRVEFTDIKKLLVFVPALPAGSEIDVGEKLRPPRGAVLGLEELPDFLYTHRSRGLFLKDEEVKDLIKEVLHLPPQAIKLTAPLGGEVWAGVREITWDTLVPWAEIQKVEISISVDGSKWKRLAVKQNDGCYRWDTQVVANGRYRIKIEARDAQGAIVGEDQSEIFTVRNPRRLITRRRALLVIPLLAMGLLLWKPWRPKVLSPQEIEQNPNKYLNRVVRVRFKVVETRESQEMIFLNSTSDRYYSDFTAAIFKRDLDAFKEMGIRDPLSYYFGKTIEVIGKVELFQGPEIVVRRPSQIKVKAWWRFWE